ncbi:thiamine/thiamine pyrophosphate ABC transporter permease ThiP [Sinorhizobium sp. 8-89]|uniref:thiamine/thiamine pyrophosphate ABC transporter permease ThiP n=1 Tax=Sinorhizobium sp. 7-81 TaxID=3049087 RepID=UPI0024C35A34|nr:thiamine/thiamine pyrophosphate ABC transporter permease ThiP [Sinorhizobium sp. 7-81]MDK1387463.1 thiamine/thiamine pyrophosphate ABC transporter permease ThiP [Sinorhizobium sp. 7-81]
MSGAAEKRMTIAAGVFSLGGILLFVGLAVIVLLAQSGGGDAGALFDTYVWRVTRFTLLQASLSTILSVLFAIPVARALARQASFPGRIWLLRLMALPLGLPALVAALGLIQVWGRQGFLNTGLVALGLEEPISIYGLFGILLAHVFFNMPLAARLMLAGIERIPGEYWRTAANLGMPSAAVFRLIEWPAIRGLLPGIAGLIFMLCATSFTLVLTLGGGPAASTIEVAIYQALRFDFDPPRAIALSGLQIALTGALLLVLKFVAPPPQESETSGKAIRRFDGLRGRSRLADALWLILALIFVGLPFVAIAYSGLQADLARLLRDPAFHRALATSAVIALLSAAVSVGATAVMIRAQQVALMRRHAGAAARGLAGTISASSSFILLVPPVVLGAGWFLLLRPFGDVARFAPAVVVAINALMALPFVYRVLAPAMATHTARTDRLVASLGIVGFHRLRWIDWPPLRKPLLMAFSFAMALSLGDLGAVALFGSQDMTTLPWLLYSRMGSYRTADAVGLALMLGVICLVLTVLGTAGEDGAREGRNA